MNDYAFGNRLYELRKTPGLSQSELAEKIGVSNKAVSKWENGRAKPRVEIIRRLAAILNTSVEELLRLEEAKDGPQITRIVITGGPCAGKSTAMNRIQDEFTRMGYTVLFVPETATELITGGVAPWTCSSNFQYQLAQMQLQLDKEKVFEQAARTMDVDKVLIVCDRGALDNKAYMDDAEFARFLDHFQTDEVTLRDSYDAVFHLVSAAIGAEDFYTTSNNSARTETVEEAAQLDQKIMHAWTGHPHLRIIDNSADFEVKMNRLIAEIASFLGEPEPLEIERKYLIEYPDLDWLSSLPSAQKVEIIQTYLISADGQETRVRQRGVDGHYLYSQTTKKQITPLKRVEVERRLSQEEYLQLLMNADPDKKPIRKDRYCLVYDNQYFEIDVYPFWKDKAILEIELQSEDQPVSLPDKLHVIEEVIWNDAYKNSSLASR